MTTVLIGLIAFLLLLVLFFATGKKTPSRPVHELPPPSLAVQLLVKDKKIIEAIKLYRQETGTSLYEAKQAVDQIRG